MIKSLLFIPFILFSFCSFGQGRGVNLGFNKFGIGLGCLPKQYGIRLNFWDKDCGEMNGLSVSFSSSLRKVSGASIGLLVAGDSVVNGLQFGTLASAAVKINGVSIGGLLGGGKKINGLMIAGLGVMADTMNGVFISGTGSKYWNTTPITVINGVTIGIIGGCLAKKLNGLSIGLFHNQVEIQNGVCISMWNRAGELHGIQIGLLNYAGNNRRLFRWLPFINMNFRKKVDNFGLADAGTAIKSLFKIF